MYLGMYIHITCIYNVHCIYTYIHIYICIYNGHCICICMYIHIIYNVHCIYTYIHMIYVYTMDIVCAYILDIVYAYVCIYIIYNVPIDIHTCTYVCIYNRHC